MKHLTQEEINQKLFLYRNRERLSAEHILDELPISSKDKRTILKYIKNGSIDIGKMRSVHDIFLRGKKNTSIRYHNKVKFTVSFTSNEDMLITVEL